MKFRFLLVFIITTSIVLFTCSIAKHISLKSFGTKAESTVPLQILAINDFHGQLTFGTKIGNHSAGSAPVLESYLKAQSVKERNTIIIEAGDLVGASAAASAFLRDEPTIQFFNQLGNDYCGCDTAKLNQKCNLIGIPGNHEFDSGLGELKRLLNGGNHKEGPFSDTPWTGATFPVISANIKYRSSGHLVFLPYIVKNIDGVQVAFIGATLKATPLIVKNFEINKLSFSNEVDAINSFIPEIKSKGIKAIVAIIHNGGTQTEYTGVTEPELKDLKGPIVPILECLDPEIDVVITAHQHSFTNSLYTTHNGNSFLVTQAWSKGAGFADIKIELSKETGDIVKKSAEIVTAFANKGPALRPDKKVESFVTTLRNRIAPIVNRTIGNAACDITRIQNQSGESSLGNLIADAHRKAMGSDFALVNNNGIRTNLRAGSITWSKLYYMQPDNNDLIKITLTGQQIIDILNQQWINRKGRPSILQISGFNYTWDSKQPDSNRVIEIYAGATPLNRFADYTVTVTKYLSDGGDNFSTFLHGRDKIVGPVDLKALEEYITSYKDPLDMDIQNRIRRK